MKLVRGVLRVRRGINGIQTFATGGWKNRIFSRSVIIDGVRYGHCDGVRSRGFF